jgi:hypothetical protein
LEFSPSARGWCYVLEGDGLGKGDFDTAERLINDCRKSRLADQHLRRRRQARLRERREGPAWRPEAETEWIVEQVLAMPDDYLPISFWKNQPNYVQMLTEKGDICQLFKPVCAEFFVPVASTGGWGDLNGRAEVMARFRDWEQKGKQCVLLYIGDFDPGGLRISDALHSNLEEMAKAVGWSPDNLNIERFGLDYDFIEAHGLTWIDGLETGSGKRLEDPTHPDYRKPYVQDYLRRYGARKVESNALLNARHREAGYELCRKAILKYVDAEAPERYRKRLERLRARVRKLMLARLEEEFGS